MTYDLVLSSGFLAFARHAGVLRAVSERGDEVTGICGTSSGALVGALWAAGCRGEELASRLSVQTPLSMMKGHVQVWKGLFTMDAVVSQLSEWLPERIEDLPFPFGVGVMGPDGRAQVLTQGPLPLAVAASCAIPYIFSPVFIGGIPYRDGGVVDRTGLDGWRASRGPREIVLHLVERSGGAKTDIATFDKNVHLVQTPRSHARFWNLGDFDGQLEHARQIALSQFSNGFGCGKTAF